MGAIQFLAQGRTLQTNGRSQALPFPNAVEVRGTSGLGTYEQALFHHGMDAPIAIDHLGDAEIDGERHE
jgi:hypothetical protein